GGPHLPRHCAEPEHLGGRRTPERARGFEQFAQGACWTMNETAVQARPGLIEEVVLRATAENLVDVAYTTMESPLGTLLLAATPVGLVRIAYAGSDDFAAVL